MSELELILTKLKIVSEAKENGAYICDKEHSKILLEEIERLNSIIKEVREYIEKTKFKYCDDELCYMIENHYNRILEILDKENK